MSDTTIETGNIHVEGVLKLHKQEEGPTITVGTKRLVNISRSTWKK